MKLQTFLNFGGNCEAAFRFYEKHLGGAIAMLMPREDQSVQYAIMHLGDTQLMGADVGAERFQPMRSAYLTLTVDTPAEAERVWTVLSEGGSISMPMEETFFAARFGQLRDRFGTLWMIMALKP